MTQIKLRRDTSAAFASSNPILGNGEPAYETDTKKLKIGDGTTAYTQLEYFSAGGGSSTDISATLPLKIVDGVISLEVDGQTIQIVDGKLTASSTVPANMVTTETTQDITGTKSFTTGKTTFKNQDNNRKILGEINGNGFYCNYFTDKASGEKPCYLGKVSQTTFNLGIPDATGTEGRIYATTLEKWQNTRYIGTILDSSNLGSYVDGTTITYTNEKLSAASSGGGLEVKSATTADFNSPELLETGLYRISGGLSPQNAPTPYAVSAMLITMKYYNASDNQLIQQTWIGCEDLVANQIYTRYSQANGVMTSWVRVDSNKIASSSVLGSIKVGNGLTISSDGTLSASGGSAPSNMVTTDTAQTISGDKTFTGGNTFQEHITIGNTGTGQIDKLKLAALNGSATSTTLYNGLQIYTDIDTYTSTLRVGDVNLPMILQGSTIKDSNGKDFITGSNFVTFCQNNADAIKAALGL